MSVAQFNVVVTYLFGRAFEAMPEPIHVAPSELLLSINDISQGNAEEWHKAFAHSAIWLRDEGYLRIGAMDCANVIHGLTLTEKGLRLLSMPSSLEQTERTDWGGSAVRANESGTFETLKIVGKTILEEATKMVFKSSIGQ